MENLHHNTIQYYSGEKLGNCFYIKDVPMPAHRIKPCRFALFKCQCGKKFECAIEKVKCRGDVCKVCRYNKVSAARKTHGESRRRSSKYTKEFSAWNAMQGRCYNKNNSKYPDYGERGIIVCIGWLGKTGFSNFLDDMGRAPSKIHSLDRKDVNGNYSCGHCEQCLKMGYPKNCRWETPKVQGRNKRISRILTFKGQSLNLYDWAEIVGISATCIRSRIVDRGWTVDQALTKPARVTKKTA